MKLKLVFLILILLLTNCGESSNVPQEKITISGKVRFATQGLIKLVKLDPNNIRVVDTLQLINNQYFVHTIEVDTPDFYQINFFDKQGLNIIIDKDDIDIIVDGNSKFGYAKIYGSRDHDMLDSLRRLKDKFENAKSYIALEGAMRKARIMKDTLALDSLSKHTTDTLKERNELIKEFISSQETSLAMIQAARLLTLDEDLEFKEKLALRILEKYPTSSQAISFAQRYGVVN